MTTIQASWDLDNNNNIKPWVGKRWSRYYYQILLYAERIDPSLSIIHALVTFRKCKLMYRDKKNKGREGIDDLKEKEKKKKETKHERKRQGRGGCVIRHPLNGLRNSQLRAQREGGWARESAAIWPEYFYPESLPFSPPPDSTDAPLRTYVVDGRSSPWMRTYCNGSAPGIHFIISQVFSNVFVRFDNL